MAMYNPVTLSTDAYPRLDPSIGSVYGTTPSIPTNNVSTPPSTVVFGLNSVSEPNTSPDVTTVSCRLHKGDFPQTQDKYVLPGGTPVLVVPDGKDRHNDVQYTLYMLNQHPRCRTKVDDLDAKAADGFLTVTVGDASFAINSRENTYAAVAVQNVATLSLIHGDFVDKLRGKALGDRIWLCASNDRKTKPGICTDNTPPNSTLCRELKIVAPALGYQVRCDVGAQYKTT